MLISKTVTRYLDYATIGATVTVVAGHQLLHGPLMSKIQQTVQMYKDGFPVKLPDELKTRCFDVLKKAKIVPEYKSKVSFFLVSGDTPYHWGETESRYGTIVGVPWNFMYKDTKEIDLQELRVFGDQVVSWDTKAGKQLLASLIFTDQEQKFAIARELYMTDTHRRVLMPINIVVSAMLARSFVCQLNLNRKLMAQARIVRGAAKLLVVMFCGLNFIIARDMLHMYYEGKADARASDLDITYHDAAISYYAKLLQRGKAYRKLMGDDGAKYFTEEGDEKRPFWHFLFVHRSIPYFDRLNHLDEKKNEHYEVD